MSGSVEVEAGFWLPSEFFDDTITEKENISDEFCFPTEFPYDFETKTAGGFKEKRRVLSTSPQSTLSHLWSFSSGGSSNGSPNAVASPPTTPLGAENEAVGELIYRAAGQVAKLKLNVGNSPGPTKLLLPPRRLEPLYPAAAPKKPAPSVLHNIYLQEQMMKQQKQGSGMWCGESQMYRGWSAQQNPTRLGSFGGSVPAVKRECAGTGVFLPRRYANLCNDSPNAFSSDSRKRPGHSTAPYIPQRNVHHVPTQPQFNPGFFSDYDLLVARRNALIVQHRRSLLVEKSSSMSRGMYLPQEWTY